MVRKAIESLYTGKCSITVFEKSQNTQNKRQEFAERVLYVDIPCKLSYFDRIKSVAGDGDLAGVNLSARLFISPEIFIPAGSKITVTQNGRTTSFCRSGESAVYPSHQEVMLEIFKSFA